MAFDERPLALGQYRDFLRLLFGWLKPALQGKFDVSDLIQETLLRAQVKMKQFRGKTPAESKAWLRKIAQGILLDKVRQFHGPQRNVKLERQLRQDLEDSASQLD